MVKDRLADLKAKRPSVFRSFKQSIRRSLRKQGTVGNFLEDVSAIDNDLALFKDGIEETKRLQATVLSTSGPDKKIDAQLAACNAQNRSRSSDIRKLINNLREKHGVTSPANFEDSSEVTAGKKVVFNQLERLTAELSKTVHEWHQAQATYGDKLKERLRRQYSIVGESKTDQELSDILVQDEPRNVFTGNILQEINDAQAVLDQVQEREKEILKLEKSVVQVHELFNDFQTLVTEQGETITTIESRVKEASGKVEVATKELKRASSYKSKWRKNKVKIVVVVVVILVVIGAIIAIALTV